MISIAIPVHAKGMENISGRMLLRVRNSAVVPKSVTFAMPVYRKKIPMEIRRINSMLRTMAGISFMRLL